MLNQQGSFFMTSSEADYLLKSFSPDICPKRLSKFKFIQKNVFTANHTLRDKMMPAIKVVSALLKRATNETNFFDLVLFEDMRHELMKLNLTLPKEFETFEKLFKPL